MLLPVLTFLWFMLRKRLLVRGAESRVVALWSTECTPAARHWAAALSVHVLSCVSADPSCVSAFQVSLCHCHHPCGMAHISWSSDPDLMHSSAHWPGGTIPFMIGLLS